MKTKIVSLCIHPGKTRRPCQDDPVGPFGLDKTRSLGLLSSDVGYACAPRKQLVARRHPGDRIPGSVTLHNFPSPLLEPGISRSAPLFAGALARGENTKLFSPIDSIRLEILKIYGENRLQRLALRQVHEGGVSKIHRAIMILLHQQLQR